MGNSQEPQALPEGWECKKLIDVLLSLENGARPKGGVDNIEDGVPSIGAEHLSKDGGFLFKNMKFIPIKFFANMARGIIKNGDVLVVKDGATTGKVSLIRDDFPYRQSAVNEHVFICRPNQKYVLPEYLFYDLFSPMGKNKILRSFHGAAQGGINTQFAIDYDFPLPPLQTQRRIVSILEKAEETKRLRAQADELTERLLQSVFLEMFGDPVKNPKGWEIKMIRDIADIIVPTRDKPKKFDGDVPWVTLPDVLSTALFVNDSQYKLSTRSAKEVSARLFPKDTVLLSCAGTLGRVAIAKCALYSNQQFYGLVCKTDKISPIFLAFNLLRKPIDYYHRISGNFTIPFFRKEIALNINVFLPPLPLQQKFARIVEKVEAMRQSQAQSKQQIEDLFSALVQKAFRGEI